MGVKHTLMKKTLIEHYVVPSGGQPSITFSSIPQSYDGLLIVTSLRNDTSSDEIYIKINNSSSNFTQRSLRGEGASVITQSRSTNNIWVSADKSTYTANTFSNSSLYFPNYAGSSHKSISMASSLETNGTDGRNMINALLWSSTDAITQIELIGISNFVQYSSASLYGVTAGNDGTTTTTVS